MTILRFDSPGAIGRYMQTAAETPTAEVPQGYRNLWKTEEFQKSFAKAISGDDSLVPEAEAIMAEVSAYLPTPDRVPVDDVAGGYPNVAAFLAGDPMCMRRRAYDATASAPVAFYFGISPNAHVSREQIKKYGICVLALVWAVSMSRPVTLHTIEFSSPGDSQKHKKNNNEVITVCRIATDPLDLASACHVLTSDTYARNVCFQAATAAGGNGGAYPSGYSAAVTSPYMVGLRQRLEIEDEAIIFPSLHSDSLAIRDPIGWIKMHLAQITDAQE